MMAKSFLKYRNVWIGCAMLWIIWLHYPVYPAAKNVLFLKDIGCGGVDICLFASGLGCYYSLQKDPDAYRFIKRRFARLMPTYLCFIVVWILFRQLTNPIPKTAILGNLMGVQNLTGLENEFNWYISVIFLLYFLAPYFCAFADRNDGIFRHLAFLMLLVAVSVPFWGVEAYTIMVTRLAIFYIGILFGKLCSKNAFPKYFSAVSFIAAAVGMIVMYFLYMAIPDKLRTYGLYWYPFILITPGLCILISMVAQLLEKSKPGRLAVLCLEKIGGYSFEVYLIHLFVFEVLEYMTSAKFLPDVPYLWLGSLGLIVVLCVVLRAVTKAVQSGLRKITKGGKQ